jgi:hypothetical protein
MFIRINCLEYHCEWLPLLAVWAFYLFVIPHDSNFAPEVGRSGLFIIIGGIFSACYLGIFILIVIPIYLLLRHRQVDDHTKHDT